MKHSFGFCVYRREYDLAHTEALMADAIQAAIIAGSLALVGVFVTQIVSFINQIVIHRLTLARENQKYFNEVYQKLFAPIIPELFLIADIISHYRKRHDISEEEEAKLIEKVVKHIESNLIHASPVVVSAYYGTYNVLGNERGGTPPGLIYLLLAFINEYAQIIRRSTIYERSEKLEQLRIIVRYRVIFLLWAAFGDIYADADAAGEPLVYSFMFDRRVYTEKGYRKIEKLRKSKYAIGQVEENVKKILRVAIIKKEDFDFVIDQLKHTGAFQNGYIPVSSTTEANSLEILDSTINPRELLKTKLENDPISVIIIKLRPDYTLEQADYITEKVNQLVNLLEVEYGREGYISEDVIAEILGRVEKIFGERWHRIGIGAMTGYDHYFSSKPHE
jgi:hypothetical protein